MSPSSRETITSGIVETRAGLEALGGEWWALWRRCPDAHPFASPAWALPWWRAFAPGALFAVTVREAGRLVALAPLYIEEGAFGRRVLPMGLGVSDYLDVLVDPGCEGAGTALMDEIAGHRARWDACCLEELEPRAAALRLPSIAGTREEAGPQSACPVLALGADLGASLPSKKRRNLALSRNRTARGGGAEHVPADAASLAGHLSELVRLHGLRWASRGEEGVLADPRVREFQAEAAPLLLEAGLLRCTLLRIAGRSAAAYLGFHHGGRAYAYLTGVDPDFAYESAGTLLVGHAVENALAEGAAEFHFLRGQEAYKYEWGAVDRWNVKRVFVNE